MKLEIPKDKKTTRLTLLLDYADIEALKKGMLKVGETNMSSYIRRLIHAKNSHKLLSLGNNVMWLFFTRIVAL